MGACNYYRRCFQKVDGQLPARVLQPLYSAATRKIPGKSFEQIWKEENLDEHFERSKRMLKMACELNHPDPNDHCNDVQRPPPPDGPHQGSPPPPLEGPIGGGIGGAIGGPIGGLGEPWASPGNPGDPQGTLLPYFWGCGTSKHLQGFRKSLNMTPKISEHNRLGK